MDYCWQGRIWVFVGAVSLAIGGWIATYGWNVWSGKFAKGGLFRKGAWDITRGTLAVAFGGLLATHGWNVISLGEQRRNLIRAVAQEVVLNCVELDSLVESPLAHRVDLDGTKLKILPVLKTNALNAVLSSGLWSFDNPEDDEFLMACMNCVRRVEKANSVLGSITNKLVTAVREEDLATARVLSDRLESPDYQKQLKHLFDDVITFIAEDHEWALKPPASKQETNRRVK